MRFKAWCLFVQACLLAPAFARAYTAQSLDDFQAAQGYQAARQWLPAVRAYQAALRDDPSLTQAYKGLGTVYYLAGDRKGALFFYDRYLAVHTGDLATKNFADRLRASLGLPPPTVAPSAAPEVARQGGPFRPGFDLRLPLTGLYAGASDVDQFYDVAPSFPAGSGLSYSNQKPGSSLGLAGVGLGCDYGLSNGFVAGFDLLYGPSRSPAVTNSYDWNGQELATQADTYGIRQYSELLTPGWRFKVGDSMVLEPRLGLGMTEASVAYGMTIAPTPLGIAYGLSGSPVAYTATSTGLGFVIWPELRGEYLFGQIGVGASLGFLYQTPTAQKYTAVSSNVSSPGTSGAGPVPVVGQTVGYQTSSSATTLTKWALSTSGLTFGVFITYHFQPLFW